MELIAGYKQTEAGVIPVDWTMSTVGKEFDVRLGKMLDAEKNAGEPKPYIGNSNVQWGKIHLDNLQQMRMTRDDMQQFRLRIGDLLACEGGEVGRAAIWNAADVECYYQKALHRLRPLRGFDPRLMLGFLQLWSLRGDLANYVTQTSIAHLPREKFVEVPLPVPPLPEQSAIATALSDVDALLSAQDALIAKKRAIKQGAMQELLTGKRRLPGFNGEWEVKTLNQFAEIGAGINKPLSEMGSGSLYVTVQDLYEGNSIRTDRLSRIKVSEAEIEAKGLSVGDIVFGKSSVKREGIGYPSIFLGCAEPVVFSGFTYRARARSCIADAGFLFYALRSSMTRRWLIDNSQASALTNINQFIADAIPIWAPPTITEQSAIAAVLSDIEAEITALESQRAKTAQLKQGMMQALLTGRIRLV